MVRTFSDVFSYILHNSNNTHKGSYSLSQKKNYNSKLKPFAGYFVYITGEMF